MVLKSALLVLPTTALMTTAISRGVVIAAQGPTVNLTGTWSGTGHDTSLGQPDAITVTWVLRQTGSTVSGTVQTLPLNAPTGSCSSCHRVKTGTISGTVSGTALTLSMDFPEPSGGPTPSCTAALTGFAGTVANDAFTAAYSGTDSCEGALNGTLVMALETAPVITSQPANQTIVLGQTATLGVTASGTDPLAYRWEMSSDLVFGWTALPDAGPYNGVTTPTLKVTPTSASQTFLYYRCVITNSAGAATSTGVYVWAYSAPVIGVGALLPPGQVDVVVKAGQDATFVVVQSFGAILGWPGLATFQWQVSNDRGASWNNLSAGAPYSITGSLSNHSASQFLTIANVPVAFGGLQYRVVATNTAGPTTSHVSTLTVLPATPKRFLTDADGDRKSEIAVFRPSSGGWFIRKSSEGYSTATAPFYQWGLPGDVPIAADFDGDGKTELSVFRPPTGQWFIRYSLQNYNASSPGVYQWGLPGDIPIPGDFDGDGRSELAVFRPSIGGWFIRKSTEGYSIATASFYQWGLPGDVPIAGDFDGDGKTELAVFRPPTGQWFIRYSSQNYDAGTPGVYQWGLPGDVPLAGDFDGDGRNDLAVFRPPTGQWFIRYSAQNFNVSTAGVYQWGLPGDVPLVVDFDTDFKTELTVFRPATGEWFIRYSTQNYDVGSSGLYQWGLPGDVPIKP